MIREPGWGAVPRYKKGGVTCPTCYGDKEFWHPDDPRDPVEGNKMRRAVKCPTCEGSGRVLAGSVKRHLEWCLEEYRDLA